MSYPSTVVDGSCTSQNSVFILFDLEMAHEFSLLTLLHGVYPLFCAELVLPTSFLYEREQNNYVRTALCDLGAGVSVMPFYLYKRLCLEKLIPTNISLQMADKSMVVLIGICDDVPVEVANCPILTDFVVLDMPEDGSTSIILGRPFLNTAGAVIDCNKGKVTFT